MKEMSRAESTDLNITRRSPATSSMPCVFFFFLSFFLLLPLFVLFLLPFFLRSFKCFSLCLSSVKLSRLSFLNPCPCSKEQVLLDQHKDGEIVGTCKCLLAIFRENWKQQDSDACPWSNPYDLPAPCVYLPSSQWIAGWCAECQAENAFQERPSGWGNRDRKKRKGRRSQSKETETWYMQMKNTALVKKEKRMNLKRKAKEKGIGDMVMWSAMTPVAQLWAFYVSRLNLNLIYYFTLNLRTDLFSKKWSIHLLLHYWLYQWHWLHHSNPSLLLSPRERLIRLLPRPKTPWWLQYAVHLRCYAVSVLNWQL